MATPKVLVLRCAGINCNEETAHAWNMVGAEAEQVHLNRLLESPALLDRYAVVSIPEDSPTATTSPPGRSSPPN